MSKGQELFDQAEKKLKKWFSFGSGKYEEAGDLFQKAGNQFKISKEWKSAGTAFMRCSDCRHHTDDQYESVEMLVEAGKCYKKVKCDDAVLCFKTAVDLLCDEGKFTQAARLQKELAEYYVESDDLDKAVESYKKAADFFKGEEQVTSANGVTLEIGRIYAESLAMPEEAVQCYETVAMNYLRNGSMKYHVKDLYLKCMMCRFLTIKNANLESQIEHCKAALEKYCDNDINFPGTREAELVEEVLAACVEEDGKLVGEAAAKFDSVKKLDDFQVDCLQYLRKLFDEDDPNRYC
eukprot:TRINITY_DN9015_c0_g1_i1.p1 TRINITY_DN9015_c0_g1~~TRINITY_DN9015_c0_g1_i1.p1  ORF type:complete len:313 (+),score=83.46 TRINITY_DN9015_c0_g1_i1:62-940(+)